MVVGAIQRQQKSPFWGAVKKETVFSANGSIVIQHSCAPALWCYSSITGQPSGGTALQPRGEAALWLDSSTLLGP